MSASSTAIIRTANLFEADMSAAIGSALEYLRVVRMDRTHHKNICEECKVSVRAHYTADEIFTRDIKVHYSFDYAKQVRYL